MLKSSICSLLVSACASGQYGRHRTLACMALCRFVVHTIPALRDASEKVCVVWVCQRLGLDKVGCLIKFDLGKPKLAEDRQSGGSPSRS
jgi:hypothetical protein